MVPADGRVFEAINIWDWIQWRLTPDLWIEAQQILGPTNTPTPTDPVLAAGFAELINPSTTRARKLQLLVILLNIIKDSGWKP